MLQLRGIFASAQGLVITDGTPAGTTVISIAGADLASASSFTTVGSKVFFATAGPEPSDLDNALWATDFSAAGTREITTLPNEQTYPYAQEILSIARAGLSHALIEYGPTDFGGAPELWSTDGTAAGTVKIPGVTQPDLLYGATLTSGALVFGTAEGLVASDGTAAGTVLLKADPVGPEIGSVVSLGGSVVFAASSRDPTNSISFPMNQLWVSDGSAAGTRLITTLPDDSPPPGPSQALISDLTALGSKAVFVYDDGRDSASVWVTDGSAAGTRPLPGTNYPDPMLLTLGVTTGNRLVFVTGAGLEATDGTPSGTMLIKPRLIGAGGFFPVPIMASLGNEVIFAAGPSNGSQNPGAPVQLWKTDGTAAGTSLIATLPSAGPLAGIGSMAVLDDRVLFTYNDGNGDNAVWSTDGTAAGTVRFLDHANTPGGLFDFAVLPCFAAGTRIRTAGGDVAVETLAVGDVVLSPWGERFPVAWIGHRSLRCSRQPDPSAVWPIRISAHAFADGMPQRDLYLSPDHSVFINGVLIPIRHLVNGASVAQVAVEALTYWHVELAQHRILLAEGLPTESYLDDGNRGAFEDADRVIEPSADLAGGASSRRCAPLVQRGWAVERVRQHLLRRLPLLESAAGRVAQVSQASRQRA